MRELHKAHSASDGNSKDFLFEGPPLERMRAKAKESNQALVFLFEEPPLERMLVKA